MRLQAKISVLLLAILAMIEGCKPGSSPATHKSPSGAFEVITTTEEGRADSAVFGCVVIEVRNKDGVTIHKENTHISDFQTWELKWKSDDAFEIISSDIGTRRWTRDASGKWKISPL